MNLGITGKLPKVFSAEDLQWLRSYLKTNGETANNNTDRAHLSNFHKQWEPVNDLLKSKLHPVIGDDFDFCLALANIKYQNDYLIHTDICFRRSTMPQGMKLPMDKEEKIYYTFLIVEDYEREYGNYKPSTYIFENYNNTESETYYSKDSIIDPSWPIYNVDEKTKNELSQYPVELLSRFKILAVLDQEPLSVNYWHSVQFHTQDAYSNLGVKWKKYFTIVGCKKI